MHWFQENRFETVGGHALRPHIVTARSPLFKIKYVNRGIDFIDLPSIFRDKIFIN